MARRSMGLQFAIHFRARHTDPTVSERSRCVSSALLSDDNRWVKRAAHRSVRWDVTVKEANASSAGGLFSVCVGHVADKLGRFSKMEALQEDE
jgi:hypothetical protein